jgi:hypothetical protein
VKAHIEFDVIHLNASVVFYDYGNEGRIHCYVPGTDGMARVEVFDPGTEIPDSVKVSFSLSALESLVEEARKLSVGVGQLDTVVLDAFKRDADRVDRLIAHLTGVHSE